MRFSQLMSTTEAQRLAILDSMTDEEIVKLVYPDAHVVVNPDWLEYHTHSIESLPGIVFRIGGGRSDAEAWQNARVHLGVYRD